MALTRRVWIERCLRQIYNGQPPDDATITTNLVNVWLQTGIGIAVEKNYKDNLTIEGVKYINSSFYTTFKNLSLTYDEQFTWKITLPEVPVGIGAIEGISTVVIKDQNLVSYPVVMMNENQRSVQRGMRLIPNKVLGYYQGNNLFIESTLILNQYVANVTMVSGGDSTDLDSVLNVPSNYDPVIIDYIRQQLMIERQVPVDATNDGLDALVTT